MASARHVIIAGAGIGGLTRGAGAGARRLPRDRAGAGAAAAGDRRRHPAFAQRHARPDRARPARAAAAARRRAGRGARDGRRLRPSRSRASRSAPKSSAATARLTGRSTAAICRRRSPHAARAEPDIALKLGTRSRISPRTPTASRVHGRRGRDSRRGARHRADRRRRPVVDACADAAAAPARRRVSRHRTAWRALVPAERVPAEFRAPVVHLWLGHDAHLVHYPVQGRHAHQHRRHRARRMERAPAGRRPATRAEILRHFARWTWCEHGARR